MPLEKNLGKKIDNSAISGENKETAKYHHKRMIKAPGVPNYKDIVHVTPNNADEIFNQFMKKYNQRKEAANQTKADKMLAQQSSLTDVIQPSNNDFREPPLIQEYRNMLYGQGPIQTDAIVSIMQGDPNITSSQGDSSQQTSDQPLQTAVDNITQIQSEMHQLQVNMAKAAEDLANARKRMNNETTMLDVMIQYQAILANTSTVFSQTDTANYQNLDSSEQSSSSQQETYHSNDHNKASTSTAFRLVSGGQQETNTRQSYENIADTSQSFDRVQISDSEKRAKELKIMRSYNKDEIDTIQFLVRTKSVMNACQAWIYFSGKRNIEPYRTKFGILDIDQNKNDYKAICAVNELRNLLKEFNPNTKAHQEYIKLNQKFKEEGLTGS